MTFIVNHDGIVYQKDLGPDTAAAARGPHPLRPRPDLVALLSHPPSAAEPDALPVRGFQGSAEEIERQWYEQVYRGRGDRMPQLTWRAVLMGSALGGVLSLTNLYIGLKAGWGFGVAITACILSYAIWTALHRVGLARTPMTILENNCMQSTASAAGYSTGGTLISAFAAYMLINDRTLSLPGDARVGVLPRRARGDHGHPHEAPDDQRRAAPLPERHRGRRDARGRSTPTGSTGCARRGPSAGPGSAALLGKFWAEGLVLVSATLAPFMIGTWMHGVQPARARAGVDRADGDALLGAHVHRGRRHHRPARRAGACCSGSITAWMIFVPVLQHQGVIEGSGYGTLVQWTLWGGVACMVTSSLLSFALQWRTALRAFADLGAMFGGRGARRTIPSPPSRRPPPGSCAGQVVGFVGLAWLGHVTFGMPYWQTAVAVLLSFAAGARRLPRHRRDRHHAGGRDGQDHPARLRRPEPGQHEREPDERQRHRGGREQQRRSAHRPEERLSPRARIPASSSSPSSRASSSGTLVSVLSFRLLVPDASALGADQFPAPAAQTWRAVARRALPRRPRRSGPVKTWSIAIGGLVGIVLSPCCRRCSRSTSTSSRHRPGSAWRGPSTGTTGCSSSSGARSAWWVETEVSAVVGGVHLPGGLGLDRRREPHGRDARDVGERARARAPADRPLELAERAQIGGQRLQLGLGQLELRHVLHRPAGWRLAEPAGQILARILRAPPARGSARLSRPPSR